MSFWPGVFHEGLILPKIAEPSCPPVPTVGARCLGAWFWAPVFDLDRYGLIRDVHRGIEQVGRDLRKFLCAIRFCNLRFSRAFKGPVEGLTSGSSWFSIVCSIRARFKIEWEALSEISLFTKTLQIQYITSNSYHWLRYRFTRRIREQGNAVIASHYSKCSR